MLGSFGAGMGISTWWYRGSDMDTERTLEQQAGRTLTELSVDGNKGFKAYDANACSIYVAKGGDVITWSIQTMNPATLPDLCGDHRATRPAQSGPCQLSSAETRGVSFRSQVTATDAMAARPCRSRRPRREAEPGLHRQRRADLPGPRGLGRADDQRAGHPARHQGPVAVQPRRQPGRPAPHGADAGGRRHHRDAEHRGEGRTRDDAVMAMASAYRSYAHHHPGRYSAFTRMPLRRRRPRVHRRHQGRGGPGHRGAGVLRARRRGRLLRGAGVLVGDARIRAAGDDRRDGRDRRHRRGVHRHGACGWRRACRAR